MGGGDGGSDFGVGTGCGYGGRRTGEGWIRIEQSKKWKLLEKNGSSWEKHQRGCQKEQVLADARTKSGPRGETIGHKADGQSKKAEVGGKNGKSWEQHWRAGKGTWTQKKYWVMHEPNRDGGEKSLERKAEAGRKV